MIPKVSVVTATYNAENVLRQMLDSLISQTFIDWECVIVDDKSTDGTLQIIKEYAEADPRIRYKTLESNTGSGKIPFDTAVAIANSEWIIPVGHDDVLAADVIEKSVKRQIETQADIVLIKMVRTDACGNITGGTIPSEKFNFANVLTGIDAAKLTIGEWKINANGGLFSKKLFARRRPVKNYMNADEYDTRQLLIAADKVAFADANYYYRVSANSITRKFSMKLFDTLYTNKLLSELIQQTYPHDDLIQAKMDSQIFQEIIYKRCILLRNKDKLSGEERQNINRLIKDNYYAMSITNRCRANMRRNSPVKRFLLGINYTLFCAVTYIWVKVKR